ncbi:hypothetical protein [Metaclostridioides mangenotii]|uniref:hypothetical protein n=1 Tax=Metaclostridioides mangenotii TaxID=1540 RepID=UPI0004868458|nr:hypothetical protein [Clostridioides mangenotii]
MKENIKGFWYLCWLVICIEVFLGGMQETVHLLAIGEYIASGIIAIITGVCFWSGGNAIGLIRKYIQKENKN